MRKRSYQSTALILLLVLSLLSGCALELPELQPTYYAPASESSSPLPELVLLTPSPEEEAAVSPEAEPTPEPENDEPSPEPTDPGLPTTPSPEPLATALPVREDESYSSKEDVALYLYVYGHLPPNYITKGEAESLGWRSGGLDKYAYGCCIGGDRFGNYNRQLPVKSGRIYYECDIGTMHKRSRGAKRIIWSNDGLIYYTGNHYESFTLLYGEA